MLLTFLQRQLRRPPRDFAELGRALALLLTIRGALACLPFDRLRAALERALPLSPTGSRRESEIRTVLWAVQTLERHVPRTSCLAAALTAQALLRRRGTSSELRVGIAKAPGFKAHAWLEREGEILLGHSSTVFDELPLDAAPAGPRA